MFGSDCRCDQSEFSKVARTAGAAATTGESVRIIGLRQVIESDVARSSLIHESSLARSCADVGAFGAGVSVSGSAASCVAALPADRALTYDRVAANACGDVASACNSGSLDTVNLLRVQLSTSCNLQGLWLLIHAEKCDKAARSGTGMLSRP